MITGVALDRDILEELALLTEADKWLLAYQLTGSRQTVYTALANAATVEHRSTDRSASLLIFADDSVIVFTAGEDETYPDLAAVSEIYGDGAFQAAFPSVANPASEVA